jgi:hypothetical protein
MKLFVFSACLLAFSSAFGQKWVPYISVEENVHITDFDNSFDYSNLSLAAANAGIRIGTYFSHNEIISGELTLGVTGIGTPGTFSNKIVPVELIGHYNLLDKPGSRMDAFKVDFGIGSGLAEVAKGNFGFSEHFSIGASMDLPESSLGVVTMGMRYTYFLDDYIDGSSTGVVNDGMLRFFTALRLKGDDKKTKQALLDAQEVSKALGSKLEDSQKENSRLQEELKALNNAFNVEAEQLKKQIDKLSASSFDNDRSIDNSSIESSTKKQVRGVAIVVGSFENEGLANEYLDSIGGDAFIIEEKDLNRYRVIFNIYDNYREARKACNELPTEIRKYWLVKY